MKPTGKQRLEYNQQGEREKADLICRQGEEDRSLKWAAQVASEAIDVRLIDHSQHKNRRSNHSYKVNRSTCSRLVVSVMGKSVTRVGNEGDGRLEWMSIGTEASANACVMQLVGRSGSYMVAPEGLSASFGLEEMFKIEATENGRRHCKEMLVVSLIPHRFHQQSQSPSV